MTVRRHLLERIAVEPRSVPSLAYELGLSRRNLEDDLRHAIQSARTAGHEIVIIPARCKACRFVFGEDRGFVAS